MQAQQPAFYHLSTAEGLNDNNVITAARDRNGILWVGTSEGLSSFDGNRITSFYKQYNPGLFANSIQWIEIDHANQVWLRSQAPFLSMLDEKRNFHIFTVGDSSDISPVKDIFSTRSRGLIVIKGNEQYILKNQGDRHFEKTSLFAKGIIPHNYSFAKKLGSDKVVFYGEERLTVVDYASLTVLLDMPLPGLGYAAEINDNELLAFTIKGDAFYRINQVQKKITAVYKNLKDQYGKTIEGDLRKMARVDENNFIITTRFSGLYYFNLATSVLKNYRHDPLDARSIGGNNTYNITCDTSGYLFVTTQTSGLHYYNLKKVIATHRPYFVNEKNEIFDGYIQWVCASGDSLLWLGAQDRLIRWNRYKESGTYVPLYINGQNISGRETIRNVYEDYDGLLWVGTTRYGVLLLNRQLKVLEVLNNKTKDSVAYNWINAIAKDHNGNMWVATLGGTLMYVKTATGYAASLIHKGPSLSLFEDKNKAMWVGTENGVFQYGGQLKQEVHYHLQNGLINNRVDAVEQDNEGNIYAGTAGGLSVIHPDGRITSYTRSNGLRNDRCEGILKDENGFMWIGNLNCVLRFHPGSKTFTVFEEGNGFNHSGFRMRCAHKSKSGEMFWGTDKGLIYFTPGQMGSSSLPLRPAIFRLQAGSSMFYFTRDEKLNFPFYTPSFVFSFSSGELSGDKKNQFLYKLEGFDENWLTPSVTGQAFYSKLPPGSYSFLLKASADGINWYEAQYKIRITIAKPWWQQTWFRLLCGAFAAIMLWLVFSYYRRKRKNKMAMMLLNTKMAETKFLNLRLQMNPHFLFNSLSAIQHLIVSQQTNKAYKYLTVFSNFLRSLLNFAEKNFIPLDEELKILKMYTELESLRFDDSFTWKITTDENLAGEEVFVPSLMVQPFAENAIWHGLLHKEGKKELSIHFSGESDDYLTCTIRDNGIGREKAKQIKEANINSKMRISKGIQIINERLELLQQKTGKPAKVEIEDLYDENKNPAGTKVQIIIPYYNPEES